MRIYDPKEIAGFLRVREEWGAFSNMHGDFPIEVSGLRIRSTEHYYQALRFPHLPDFQAEILAVPSAMFSKKKAYTRQGESREDWEEVNISAMRHALRLKYMFHTETIGALYRASSTRPIVEISNKSDFWGAKPQPDGSLKGMNVLGRLHMELRAEIEAEPGRYREEVPAPAWSKALLLGREISITRSGGAEPAQGLLF
ncbi:NADAR family protein [Paracoccus litorisediminis]|uniref:NADAR family protein n=1 Tax=Paracoccus litorisediminis TaxID=2006130 RepID=UPI0037326052